METVLSNVQEKIIVTAAMNDVLISILNKAAEVLAVDNQAEVSVVLVDDNNIRELNRQYRGLDRSTDVLSFALREGDEPEVINGPEETLLGDIVISLETAIRQADEYGHSLSRELAFLAVHGMLHLNGYDHETETAEREMRRQEEHILSLAGIGRAGA